MIKIEKNAADIPQSLIPAFPDLFPSLLSVPSISKTTHQKRMFIIQKKSYIDENDCNSRYKSDDIRIALNKIYHNKCAYCEQKVEQYNIEHYRPKKFYHWLAFSWDNLIMACPRCNQSKGVNFELLGKKVEFEDTETNIRNINSLSYTYDSIEIPKMINPEISDPLGQISFQRDGLILSENERFSYTIEKCSIGRKYLNDDRRKILDVFSRDIRSALIDNENEIDQEKEISSIVRKFVRDSIDVELEFLSFRRFAISSGWLHQIIKEAN